MNQQCPSSAEDQDPPAALDRPGPASRGRFPALRQLSPWWYPLLGLMLLAVLYMAIRELGLTADLRDTRAWIDSWGYLAPVAFVGVYVVTTTLGFPSALLTAAAGALFGSWEGVTLALFASILAATLSFLIARHLMRDWVRRRLGQHRRFRRIDRLSREHGAAMVLTVRMLNLLPFAAVNYGFGVTRVPISTYVLGSLVGRIPGTVAIVVGVDAIYQALISRQVPWVPLTTVTLTIIGLALAVRYLNQRLPANEDALDDDDSEAVDRARP